MQQILAHENYLQDRSPSVNAEINVPECQARIAKTHD